MNDGGKVATVWIYITFKLFHMHKSTHTFKFWVCFVILLRVELMVTKPSTATAIRVSEALW